MFERLAACIRQFESRLDEEHGTGARPRRMGFIRDEKDGGLLKEGME